LVQNFQKMEILTHPKELTRENLKEWRKEFVKKIERTTTREDSDRLILAVERKEFKDQDTADWTKVIYENGKGKISYPFCEEFEMSEFERKILNQNENLKNQEIKKSALKEENGDWNLDGSLKEISRGGEAVVLEETIAELKVAVRVQCFDSALFTGDMENCSFDWHLSKGYFFNCHFHHIFKISRLLRITKPMMLVLFRTTKMSLHILQIVRSLKMEK
jgi:hypothetical protein